MRNRDPRQVKDRYRNYLDPNINTESWTMEEDELLIMKREEIGPKWTKIKEFFHNRTPVNIKNHYATLIKKIKSQNPLSLEVAEEETKEEILTTDSEQSICEDDDDEFLDQNEINESDLYLFCSINDSLREIVQQFLSEDFEN